MFWHFFQQHWGFKHFSHSPLWYEPSYVASTQARRAGMLQCPPWRMPRRLSIPTVRIDHSLGILHGGPREVAHDQILKQAFRCFSLYGVNQRRDQSETKGYSDPVPKWNFQHVHVPYTPTGVLGNELKLYSYLVSVNTCKYSTYTYHTARGVRGLPTLQDLNLPAASQRFPNKLTKESGTFTSGLLGPGPWANFSG